MEAVEQQSIVRPRLKLTRNRAQRLNSTDLPWLSTVKLPWGTEVRVLNISTSGMLVETSSKVAPGSVVEFELQRGDTAVVVPAKFVRTEVSSVDGRGVWYHAAAAFENEVELEQPQPSATESSAALAGWLRQLASDVERETDAAMHVARLEQGLRALVSAREIRVVEQPAAPAAGCESIYFTVPARGGARVLQVTFDPDHVPSERDFRLLQAGAALAAVMLT